MCGCLRLNGRSLLRVQVVLFFVGLAVPHLALLANIV